LSYQECQKAVDDYRRAWESQDPAAMTAMYAPDGAFVDPRHPPFVGHEAIRDWYNAALSAFTDPYVEYVRVVIEPPHAVAEWVSYLSHGEKRFAFHGVSVFEVHDGHVTFQRDYFDQTGDAEVPAGTGRKE
jgi:uncharacterized protein (TIGR02246 family)